MIRFNLSCAEGMDVVDAYGPDPELWPDRDRDELEELLRTNDSFRDYVDQMARIERMLQNWEDADDGVEIDWDDLDDEDFDPNQEDEEDDDLAGSTPLPVQPGQTGEDTTQGDLESSEEDEDEPEHILEISEEEIESNVKDMDGHFENIIRKELESDDVRRQWNTWTRDYDALVELKTEPSDRLDLIDAAVAKSAGPLMKDLRRLIAAQSQVKRIPGMRRGRLHAPNLHRILAGDDRVFTRREEAHSLDTAITLNIDSSGSMMGSRMNLAVQTAYALGTVLSRLGIAFECLGFTDGDYSRIPDWGEYNREVQEAVAQGHKVHRYIPLDMLQFKTFDERWTPDVQRRFAYVFNHRGQQCGRGDVGFSGTPEGCANEFAARRLLRRPEARKIMITMTDGEPATMVASYERNIVWQRSVDMVKAIEAAGVDLIGIGIQHAKPKQYYSNAIVINQLEDMPVQLMALLKKILLSKRG